jgi:uncharacterized protein (DUF1330 family)
MAVAETEPAQKKQPFPIQEDPSPAEKTYLFQALWFRKPHGAARFREYLEVASPIAAEYGGRRVEGLLPLETLRGDFEPDYIFVVEWPSLDRYYEFLKDLHYQSVARLREEAVAKAVILNCRRLV